MSKARPELHRLINDFEMSVRQHTSTKYEDMPDSKREEISKNVMVTRNILVDYINYLIGDD